MSSSACRRWLCCSSVFVLLLGATVFACQTESCGPPPAPTSLDELQRMSAGQLEDLYRRLPMGRPITGVARGRLLCAVDAKCPRLKVRTSNALWRGKSICEDGHYTNRWLGGVEWISSRYVVGPSWVDGKPSVVMQYEPGTPLFANMRDEFREVCPGLYCGPLYERCPCPRLIGYLGLQVEPCKVPKGCAEGGCVGR